MLALLSFLIVGVYMKQRDELSPGRLTSLLNELNTLSVVYEQGFEWK